jgi:ribosomal protein S18 acetylase RimI-like enzyme
MPSSSSTSHPIELKVRRIHRRDINRAWEFLKLVFRDVNRDTVEYQRPLTKGQFSKTYEAEGIEQLLFEVDGEIVGYAECAYSASDSENWVNPRYFDKRGMRPLFVEELAVHPKLQGCGIGHFMLEQLQHLGRSRGCTHLVLEVAQNNKRALDWYRKRSFYRLDAAIFLAQRITAEPELLPPRQIGLPAEAAKNVTQLFGGASKAPAKKRAAAKAPPAAPAKPTAKKDPTKKGTTKKVAAKRKPTARTTA